MQPSDDNQRIFLTGISKSDVKATAICLGLGFLIVLTILDGHKPRWSESEALPFGVRVGFAVAIAVVSAVVAKRIIDRFRWRIVVSGDEVTLMDGAFFPRAVGTAKISAYRFIYRVRWESTKEHVIPGYDVLSQFPIDRRYFDPPSSLIDWPVIEVLPVRESAAAAAALERFTFDVDETIDITSPQQAS